MADQTRHDTAERIAINRQAKRRWHAIQERVEAREWREHLAMTEPDEPVFRFAAASVSEGEE